ncbi:MAG: LPS-assembly protein LptD [Ignavibacteriae bacterium]|nr:LPS-assembly protein LptD [Ignavibacteriota bacterium]
MKIAFLILILGITFCNSFAQNSDSLSSLLKVDTSITSNQNLQIDSAKTKSNEIDDIVYSSASDSLMFNIPSKKMIIYGKGEIKYKQTSLTGGKINVNFETSDLEAEGIIDSADTNAVNGLAQTPVLKEADENYEGTKLRYNFKTKKGFISAAKNKKEDSRYEGKNVNKVDKNTFFIEDGMYTTCESDTPHTHFTASEMKVIQKDKIIAKWIFMHIGGVPVPIPIPFAVFPNEKGRRSGIIAPTYGSINNRGQYFKNFGYFFAVNDYMDLTMNADYYMRGGYGLRSRLRYAKRYDFNGNLNIGYSKILIGEDEDPDKQRSTDWNLSLSHSQTFTPTLNLSANLNFQSRTYLTNNTTSYNDLLKRNITSNATLSKRWDDYGISMNVNYSRTQSLDSLNIQESLPNMSISKNQFYPFKSSSSTPSNQKWYEYIGMNYSGNLVNKKSNIMGDIKIRGGIQHNITASASPKFSYFNITPSLSYVEKWYNKKTNYVVETVQDIANSPSLLNSFYKTSDHDTIISKDEHEINMIRTFRFSLGTSTKLYGMFQPQMLGIDAFRHTLIPSISYNYTPDFSDEKWGYYDSYTKTDGTIVKYDPYANEVFGGSGKGESQSINFSLGNVFEMKTLKDPTDTTSEAKKITLLNFDISTGYNFAADSNNLSDLRLNYRTNISNLLNLSGSSSYTFYDFIDTKRINQYLANNGKGLLRITNLQFSVSTTLSAEKLSGEDRTGKKTDEADEEFTSFKKKDHVGLYEEQDTDFSIPWNLTLNYSYNFSKPSPAPGIVRSNLGVNLGFNLTKNWKFGVMGNYDFQNDEIAAPRITVYRDLECWEMNFSWNPIGTYTGYRFEIRMKAPELRDVKVTKTGGWISGR